MKPKNHSKQLPIAKHILAYLKHGKNLLAFSGGIDSSALFFVLLDHNISFDIAIINYGIREQSKEEVEYAKRLAIQHEKTCHTLTAKPIEKDFEAKARNIRYDFFHKLIIRHGYNNLITAHHFDDRLEWFFMQLTHGAGLNTLLGFQDITQRVIKNKIYYLVRPFIAYTKQDILSYNHANKIQYFLDISNDDTSYRRNFFRKYIATPLSKHFSNGIHKSFLYLEKEYRLLYPDIMVCVDYNLFTCRTHTHEIHTIDMLTKRLGYIMSSKQKEELCIILSNYGECVMGGKIVIAKNGEFIFVGLDIKWFLECFIKAYKHNIMESFIALPCDIERFYHAIKDIMFNGTIKIPKQKREFYRIQKIPKKIRPLCYLNSLSAWQ